MVFVFVVLAVTVALFVWGKLPSDLVALLALMALLLAGILNPDASLITDN